MRKIVANKKERVGRWVADHGGYSVVSDAYEAIGIEVNGELVGGVVIDDYEKGVRCTMHCAGDSKYWLNREFISAVSNYVFVQLSCRVAIATIGSKNTKSLKLATGLGFLEKCRIDDGSLDGDLVILAISRAECRWLRQ